MSPLLPPLFICKNARVSGTKFLLARQSMPCRLASLKVACWPHERGSGTIASPTGRAMSCSTKSPTAPERKLEVEKKELVLAAHREGFGQFDEMKVCAEEATNQAAPKSMASGKARVALVPVERCKAKVEKRLEVMETNDAFRGP